MFKNGLQPQTNDTQMLDGQGSGRAVSSSNKSGNSSYNK